MESKLTAIIVDDEKSSREVLTNLIESFFKEIELLGEAENVDDAFKLIHTKKPQLVFLDIQMPRQSGFNLLKPVEVKDLKETISRAKKSIALKTKSNVQIVNLLRNLEIDAKGKQIAVHAGEKVKLLNEKDIVFIEADGRYSIITTTTNERFTTPKYLKDFEEYLGSESDLIRIHKSAMINVKHIKEYSKGEPCTIEMINGTEFEVARRKKVEILERVKR